MTTMSSKSTTMNN